MFLYLGCAFACCHFARKYFSEDVEDSDIDSEEDDFQQLAGPAMMEGQTVSGNLEGGDLEMK